MAWLKSKATYDGDECMLWPFSTDGNGRGQVQYRGKVRRAHRIMCVWVKGPPPSKKHHAAHSCGNGHLGCITPKHLSWKTQSENEMDKRIHGTYGGGQGTITQLTAEQVAEIRASKGVVTADKLAEKFGLKRGGIRYWWSTTHAPRRPSTDPYSVRRRRPRKHLVYDATNSSG